MGGWMGAREREGPKKRTELSKAEHCLHFLVTKFLQLQRAPAPLLCRMTFRRFQSLRASTMHNSLLASGIKMDVFRGLIVILVFIRLKIIYCNVNFSLRTCTFYKPRIFLVFNNGVISSLQWKKIYMYFTDKNIKNSRYVVFSLHFCKVS